VQLCIDIRLFGNNLQNVHISLNDNDYYVEITCHSTLIIIDCCYKSIQNSPSLPEISLDLISVIWRAHFLILTCVMCAVVSPAAHAHWINNYATFSELYIAGSGESMYMFRRSQWRLLMVNLIMVPSIKSVWSILRQLIYKYCVDEHKTLIHLL
jgi:hypothetical protein